MTGALPLRLRNRLAATILAAVHDPDARRTLDQLAVAAASPSPWLAVEEREWADAVAERAARARAAFADVPPDSAPMTLDRALAAAARLFDAGLYFETHEILEPYWTVARGAARETLQGLIQVAVGFQHLANGNLAGARALLDEGARRLEAGVLPGLDVTAFARAVRASREAARLDPAAVPRFPGRARHDPGRGSHDPGRGSHDP